jgi:hypothetical protein
VVKPYRLFHDSNPRCGGATGRPRRSGRAAWAVETLEGRALLSQLAPGLQAHAVHTETVQHTAGGLLLGPIVEKTGPGYVVKAPRFNPAYTGVPLSQLSAAGFKAAFDGQGNLVLTGIVTANAIPQVASSPAQDASYVFGIDRGGDPVPGPIPGRPHITFDAVVEVSITPSGPTATVTDLVTGQTTNLGTGSLLFKQNALQVTVPLSTLTNGSGTNPGAWTANFFTADTVVTTSIGLNQIASFAPDFHNIHIAGGSALIVSGHAQRRA